MNAERLLLGCCATDRKTNSVGSPRATLPPPLTLVGGPRSSPAGLSSSPHWPSGGGGGGGSTLDRLLPAAGASGCRQSGDRRPSDDTYIPLDECYSGAKRLVVVNHHPHSANVSPQVRRPLTDSLLILTDWSGRAFRNAKRGWVYYAVSGKYNLQFCPNNFTKCKRIFY